MSGERDLQNNSMSWVILKEQATVLLKTGFLPPSLNTAEKVIAVILTGRELGLPMMESIRGINIIQGKPSVSPQTMLALANRTKELENITFGGGAEGVRVTIKRKGRDAHTEFFGPAEALALGLSGKDNYAKQPGTMYKWRALAANLRVTFPDAISGVYTPEEMGAEVTVGEDESMVVLEARTEAEPVPKTTDEADKTDSGVEQTLPAPVPVSSFSHILDKMLDLALPMCDGDFKRAEAMILEATSFPSTESKTTKDGKKIKKGDIIKAQNFDHLSKSEKWMNSTYGKIKKMHDNWKAQPAPQEEKVPF